MGINSSPELSQTFNSREIFKYIATLAGAKNIGKFEIKVAPDQPALPPQDPAAAPADLSVASALGPAAGLEANPGARAMQGMQL
jgi:hypothetical protein